MKKYKLRNQIISIMPAFWDYAYCIKFGLRAIQYRTSGWPNPPDYWVKRSVIKSEALRINAKDFIETGTFLGDTTWFLKGSFSNIWTIEIQENLATLAKIRFRKWRHIEVVLGDSSEVLEAVIKKIKFPAIFWLDGHYSGGITGRGTMDCPIWSELEQIKFVADQGISVLIDDARCFGKSPGYPSLKAMADYSSEHFRNHRFTVENDIIKIVP